MSKSAYKSPPLPKPNPKSDQDPQFHHESIILSSDDDDLSFTIANKSTLGSYGNETTTNPSSSYTHVDEKMMKKKEKNGGKDCLFCKKGSHSAKDCPEKSNLGSQSAKVCLNCGDFGHEMFSCNENKYSQDDLKEIQCYVCKSFGHLCCAKYAGERSREVSCYRCGELGHSGLECARVHAESGSKWTPSSCFMCGKEAHMACKCTGSSKSQKRKMRRSSSMKKNKSRRKRNKKQPSSSQLKPRGGGGWITEDLHAYNHSHGWGAPNVPAMLINNDRFHGGNGYQSSIASFHGGNGYQPSNNRFHGGNGFQSFDYRFHGGNGFHSGNLGYHGPSFYSNQGNFQYGSAVGSNGYQNRFW
ncbi:hypothetical protein SSX86_002790 [Deinandra increscens subsp. villosa]|uniref:CCHC-type domain-containing protein n=1 Tax=Deinandra increscens subsp. villosa TaxID=3103831 RepID=A0AAP0H8C4_9ASTR